MKQRTARVLLTSLCGVAVLGPAAVGQAAPGDGRFQKVTLDDHPGEPIGLAVLPDRRVLYTSRDGTVRINDPRTGLNAVAARLGVYEHDEEGLQSVALDPRFARNRWVYLYYSPRLRTPVDDPGTAVNEGDAPFEGRAADFRRFRGVVRLSRFKLRGRRLRLGTEQRILDVPVDRGICCHVGGHIDFDGRGNLLLSTGDDTNPFVSGGFTPIDERAGRNPALDAQRSAGNTNDLRGKVLRITPRATRGGYTIPEGNLFGRGVRRTRQEIYAMGLRNPFRFAVNRRTNEIYLGDYSPDSLLADPARGPAGTGRWMAIRKPANYGWPYCVTPSLAYVDFDFATNEPGDAFDCARPVNESPHNTGRRVLPRVTRPDVFYTVLLSKRFPGLGAGYGVGPMGGPAYDPRTGGRSATRWPSRYAGVPLFYEWTRDYVQAFFLRESTRKLRRMRRILTKTVLDNPMDMEFGPDGSLYVLEYGDGYNNENPEAQLARIDFARGNRTPVPAAQADPLDGPVPLRVRFSGRGSIDADGDDLRYEWHFDGDGRVDSRKRDVVRTFKRSRIVDATLRVIDSTGRAASATVQVLPGLRRPEVSLSITPPAGRPFRFGQTVRYEIGIEDGGRDVSCSRASVTYSLGHDQHAHALTTAVGCRGQIEVTEDDSHKGAETLTGVFTAEYATEPRASGQPLIGTDQVVLTPERSR